MTDELATTTPTIDAKALESLVIRGDISGLSAAERTQYCIRLCQSLGLNPIAQPFAFLKLNGKEVCYATRGATDQLAAIHRLNREIIDGPKLIDLAGTKLVYAVARATHPNGRVETSVATVPFTDPANALMRVETKAKRRVTLSMLGLGLLDESEVQDVAPLSEPWRESWQAILAACASLDDVARAWIDPAIRHERAKLTEAQGVECWRMAVDTARQRGKLAHEDIAKRDLKAACARLSAKPPAPPEDDGGGHPAATPVASETTEAVGETVTVPVDADGAPMSREAACAFWRQYVGQCSGPEHVARAHRAHIDEVPAEYREDCEHITLATLVEYKHSVRDENHARAILAGTEAPIKRRKAG